MHSINNLIKWNEQKDKQVDYESMNLSELNKTRLNVINLLKNKSLIEKLSDKGARLKSQIEKLEKLIKKKEENEVIETCQVQVNSILNKFELNLQLDENDNEKALETVVKDLSNEKPFIEPNNYDKLSSVNYFELKSIGKDKRNVKLVHDEKRLNEIKEKILLKVKNEKISKQTKIIPVDEAFLMVKEHEKKMQQIQMKQAAEKLLQGKSVNYDYSFINKSEDNIKYREPKHDDYFDYEYYDDSDDDDNIESDYYTNEENQNERHNQVSIDEYAKCSQKLNRINKNESDKQKLKYYDKELNSLD